MRDGTSGGKSRRSSTESWRLLTSWEFSWHRARAGYDIVRVPSAHGEERLVVRMKDRSKGWVGYADLSERERFASHRNTEFIDLGRVHREAASVEYQSKALAVQSLLPFVNRYGLPFKRGQRECRLIDLVRLCRDIRAMLQVADDPRLGEDEVAEARIHGHRYSRAEVRAIVAERMSAEHPSNGALLQVSTPQGLALRFEPASLADFMWMRVAQEFRQDLVHKQCRYCQSEFTVRNDKRELKRYACSPRCKKAWQRKHSQEEAS